MPADVTGVSEAASGPALLPGRVALMLDSLTVPGRPDQVATARRFVADTIGPGHPQVEIARLMTSEIVTNAIRHSQSSLPGGVVTIDVAAIADGLLVVVTDDGCDRGRPVIRDPGGEDGNGLVLVSSLSSSWGFRDRAGQTAVWFTVSTD